VKGKEMTALCGRELGSSSECSTIEVKERELRGGLTNQSYKCRIVVITLWEAQEEHDENMSTDVLTQR
jgi:hypothetical protein